MTTRRTLLSSTAAAAAAAGIGSSLSASAAAASSRRTSDTALTFNMLAVRGWDTGTANGVFPADPATMVLPFNHFERWPTKLEIYNLLEVTGLTRELVRFHADREATREELLRVHTPRYVDQVEADSELPRGAFIGAPVTPLMHGGAHIAKLTFAGAIDLALAVWRGRVKNGYMLMRPPGHHASRDIGDGFCVFNNLAGAAAALLEAGARRLLVVDWDAHHGNGTQDIFGDDPRVVIVDIHQHLSYPPNTGFIEERGAGNLFNVALAPGAGHDEAMYAMDHVVLPAIARHNPQMILVASGFDSGFTDPLGRFLFGPETYRQMTAKLMRAADNNTCRSRIAMFHEGGYDENFVGEHGLAVMEQLTGRSTGRPFFGQAVADWQNPGIYPEFRELHQQFINRVAAFVDDLPDHS